MTGGHSIQTAAQSLTAGYLLHVHLPVMPFVRRKWQFNAIGTSITKFGIGGDGQMLLTLLAMSPQAELESC